MTPESWQEDYQSALLEIASHMADEWPPSVALPKECPWTLDELLTEGEDAQRWKGGLMSDAPRLCSECRWIRVIPGDVVEYARCTHPASIWRQVPDLTSGKAPPLFALSCHFARKKDWLLVPDPCGPEGKHWEPP